MNKLWFYRSLLIKLGSHMSEPAQLTGSAHFHMNSPLLKNLNTKLYFLCFVKLDEAYLFYSDLEIQKLMT